jgi:hypothetical protein
VLAGVTILSGPQASTAHELGDAVVSLDVAPGTPGVQSSGYVGTSGSFTVDLVAADYEDLGAFNFEVVYDQAFLSAPTIATGPDVDRNPDANQAYLSSTGRSISCDPPLPSADADPSATVGVAFMSCYSTGGGAGPEAAHDAPAVLATLTFTILSPSGGSALSLRNVNMFSSAGTIELGSCAPLVATPAACVNGIVSNRTGDTDSDGCSDLEEYGATANKGGLRDPDSFWDFYDTPDAGNARDKAVTIAGDILRVAQRFGANDAGGTAPINRNSDPLAGPPPPAPGYHPAFDRGAVNGPNLWDRDPPDGTITVTGDILAVASQFGHNCVAAP